MKLVSFFETAELAVRDPAGVAMRMSDGRAMVIRVRGEDAPEYQRLRAAYLRKIGARNYRADAGDAEDYELAVAAALTDGWLLEGENGQEVPYSREAAVELYRDNPWLAGQVNRFALERGNFLTPSARA